MLRGPVRLSRFCPGEEKDSRSKNNVPVLSFSPYYCRTILRNQRNNDGVIILSYTIHTSAITRIQQRNLFVRTAGGPNGSTDVDISTLSTYIHLGFDVQTTTSTAQQQQPKGTRVHRVGGIVCNARRPSAQMNINRPAAVPERHILVVGAFRACLHFMRF